MLLIAMLAPFLGTVDPTALAPAKRTRAPSADFWFGTDMLGRDIYSRVLYGTRVSLMVGFSVAILASLAGLVDRPGVRLRALGRRLRHARDGRHDVDPADPARHRPDGADARQRRQRHHRHHHRRVPARVAAGARRGAVAARAALRRRGGGGRHAHAHDHPAPHPAQHAGAHDGAGDLHLRQRHDRGSRSCPSSAPARRRTSPRGATSWPRAARCGR